MPATACSVQADFVRRLPILFLGFLLITFTACSDISEFEEREINKVLSDSLLNMTASSGIEMDLIIDGKRKVTAISPVANTYDTDSKSRTTMTGDVEVTIWQDDGEIESLVLSNSATYHSSTSVFEFEGDVRVRHSNERNLYTELLEWTEVERKLYSPGFVIIVTPADSITGYGFRGDEDLVNYTLQRVTGRFEID